MRFKTTAPTATWPIYGSPRASAEIHISRRSRAGAGLLIDAESGEGLIPCLTVGCQPVGSLKVFDRALGRAAVYAVYAAAVVAPAFKACLYLRNRCAGRAALVKRSIRRLSKRDYESVHREYQCDGENYFLVLNAHAYHSDGFFRILPRSVIFMQKSSCPYEQELLSFERYQFCTLMMWRGQMSEQCPH